MEKENLELKENISDDIKIQEFIVKINNLYKENLKRHDYTVGIESFKEELKDDKNLKLYVQKLTEIAEEIIRSEKENGMNFLNQTYLYFMKCVGVGFERDFYKDNGDESYKNICMQIIEFAKRLKELGIDTDYIYDTYFRYFIKNVENCRNVRIAKSAQLTKQPPEVICEIDDAEKNLYNKGNGSWYKGHIYEIRKILISQGRKIVIEESIPEDKEQDKGQNDKEIDSDEGDYFYGNTTKTPIKDDPHSKPAKDDIHSKSAKDDIRGKLAKLVKGPKHNSDDGR